MSGMVPLHGHFSGLQRTLKAPIGCVGTGLHTGRRIQMTLQPADPGHGIVMRRTDLGRDIPARYDRVADTRFSTVLASEEWASARVGTVEHLMAAMGGLGIDNARVELDGPEVPIFDGSASPFVFLIDCAGIVEQPVAREAIEILRPVRVADGEAFAELRPGAPSARWLEASVSIDFSAPAIGKQAFSMTIMPDLFRGELARARTFGLLQDVDALRAAGFALGGNLNNAVVIDRDRVLNPGGLRMPDEFARHKLVDALGDLALAGAPLVGKFVAHRTGHSLNNKLLRALFADTGAWRRTPAEPLSVAA